MRCIFVPPDQADKRGLASHFHRGHVVGGASLWRTATKETPRRYSIFFFPRTTTHSAHASVVHRGGYDATWAGRTQKHRAPRRPAPCRPPLRHNCKRTHPPTHSPLPASPRVRHIHVPPVPLPPRDRYVQISLVQSPPGRRISCARAGPHGSAPKSTTKSSASDSPPPASTSTSTRSSCPPRATRSG